jgi:ADP-ribose pyrophosphatase YjhB (NUDIX family)
MKTRQIVATRGLVINNQNCLLIVSNDNITWHIPGGWLDILEEPYVGCKREIFEETGVIASVEKIIFIQEFVQYRSEFDCKAQKFDLFCICRTEAEQCPEFWQDNDNDLIKFRKFITEEEFLQSNDILLPEPLKIPLQQLIKMPNIYSIFYAQDS